MCCLFMASHAFSQNITVYVRVFASDKKASVDIDTESTFGAFKAAIVETFEGELTPETLSQESKLFVGRTLFDDKHIIRDYPDFVRDGKIFIAFIPKPVEAVAGGDGPT